MDLLGGRARASATDYTYTCIDMASEQANVEAKIVQQGQGAWVIFRFNDIDGYVFPKFGSQKAGTYVVEFDAARLHWNNARIRSDTRVPPHRVETLSE